MAVVKDGLESTSIILQEGVPTIFKKDGKSVEPVIYSVLSKPIGMFFRINEGEIANLNSKGMELETNFPLSRAEEILSYLVANFANLAVISEFEVM